MAHATLYDLEGNIIADGVQSQVVCDAAIITAREIARDSAASVVVEDHGTQECYSITPAGTIENPPAGWVPEWDAESDEEG